MQEASMNSPYDWKNNQSEEDQTNNNRGRFSQGQPKPKNDDKSLDSFCVCSKATQKTDSCQANNEADLNSFPFFFLLEYLTSPKKKTRNFSLFFNEFKEKEKNTR